jgi:predicted nucleotidyltransferase component of viral defense system
LEAVFARTDRFYLTGGTALAAFYLKHRLSQDLDLFTQEAQAFEAATALITETARQCGAKIIGSTAMGRLTRYKIAGPPGLDLIVDVAQDSWPSISAEKNFFGAVIVDSLEDIAANKLIALESRAQIKDLLDLYFLETKKMEWRQIWRLGSRKNPGLSKTQVAFSMQKALEPLQAMPDYLLQPVAVEEFRSHFQAKSSQLARESFPD